MDIAKYKNTIKFLSFIIVLFIAWYLGRYFHIDTEGLRRSLAKFPPLYSGAVYVILYVVVSFFIWLSKDFFWLAGAILFGAYISTLLVWVSESLNAVILFSMARSLGRSYVQQRLKGKYASLDKNIGCLNFAWLFLFRAVPLVPYRFLDLGAGLTSLSFRKYLAAVLLGSPIKIFWVQYILAAVGESAWRSPSVLVEYFLHNKLVFIFSLAYLVFIIIAALRIKTKG